jgi:hypothetical protein
VTRYWIGTVSPTLKDSLCSQTKPCKGGFWANALSTDMALKASINAKIIINLCLIQVTTHALKKKLAKYSKLKDLSISNNFANHLFLTNNRIILSSWHFP